MRYGRLRLDVPALLLAAGKLHAAAALSAGELCRAVSHRS